MHTKCGSTHPGGHLSLFFLGLVPSKPRPLGAPHTPLSPSPAHLQIWLYKNLLWLGLLLGGRVLRGCRTRSMWVAALLTKAHSSLGLGSDTPGTAGAPGCMTR